MEDDYELLKRNTSQLGRVILELNQLAKKPTMESDLSHAVQVLNQTIDSADRYMEDGIQTLNFTEAALFLQSATQVWTKKVDLLWDYILDYQKRMILYEDRKEGDEEVNQLEERINRFKRKKTKIVLNTPKTDSTQLLRIENLQNMEHYEPYETIEEHWSRPYPESTLALNGESDKFAMKHDTFHVIDNFPIYDADDQSDNEPIMRYKQWHELSILKHIFKMYDKGLLNDDVETITQLRIQTDLQHLYRLEHNVPNTVPRVVFEQDLQQFVKAYLTQQKQLTPEIEKAKQQFCPAETIINLERLPVPLENEKLRRISTIDLKGCNKELCVMLEKVQDIEEKCKDVSEMVQIETINTNTGTNSNCELDDSVIETTEPPEMIIIDPEPENMNSNTNNSTIEIVKQQQETVKEKQRIVQAKQDNSKKRKDVDKYPTSEPPKKCRKLSKTQLLKLAKPIYESTMGRFEKFYFMHYKTAKNEGQILTLADPEDSDCEEEFLGFDGTATVTQHINNQQNNTELNKDCEDNDISDCDDMCQDSGFVSQLDLDLDELHSEPTISDQSAQTADSADQSQYSTLEPSDDDLERMRTNVNEWRRHIDPVLKKLTGTEFDIHAYGTQIIEPMQIGDRQSFANIVKGKSTADVVRLFQTSLHLATTGNIVFDGVVEGEVSNNSLGISLVSKDRYHEHLDEFEAPSEEDFRNKLHKLQQRKGNLMSTPSSKRFKPN